MCGFLSKTCRLIGKHTKFKIQGWLNTFPSSAFKIALILLAAAALCSFPCGGDCASLTTGDHVDLTKFVFESNRVQQKLIGEEEEQLASSVSSEVRELIKRHVEKYKNLAAEVHSLYDFDEGDDGEEGPSMINREDRRRGSRSKRDTIYAGAATNLERRRRKTLNHETEGTFVVSEVLRATPQYYDVTTAIDINCQKISNKSFVFSIEDTDDQRRELMVHLLSDKELKQRLLFETDASDAVAVDIFNIKQDYFAFTTVNHEPRAVESPETINTGSTLYKVNFAKGSFDKTQKIHLPYARSSTFWSGSGEEANDKFVAIAPEKAVGANGGFTYDVMVACYRWQGGYFDYVSQLPAKNPQTIHHFDMFSHDYLAVANYQDDAGSTNIHSEIFKYHHKEARFVSFQKIQTYGAKDIRHFTFESPNAQRQEHFIAIANHCKKDENGSPQFWVQSTIMKFAELRFIPFKSFYTTGALQFLPVKDDKKFFLAMADSLGIRLLQYNGWTFVETFYERFEEQQRSPLSISLRQWSTEDKTYFTVASSGKGVQNGMYSVGFETRNDHLGLTTSVGTWCEDASRLLGSKDLTKMEHEVDIAPKDTDDKVVVHGTVTFSKGIQVDNLQSRSMRLGRGRNLGDTEFQTMATNENHFNTLEQRMNMVKARLENVVWTDRDQVIEGKVLFQNLFYQNPTLQVTNMTVGKLGSRQLSEYWDNLVFLNKPNSFTKIQAQQITTSDMSVTSLNGHPVADYARRSPEEKQVFSGSNRFTSPVSISESISVSGTFAGLSFENPKFLLSQGNQTFPGGSMNLSGTLVNCLYANVLNGRDIFFYFADAVPLSGGVITAEKRFKSASIRSAKAESVNNRNINALYSEAAFVDGRAPQSFSGTTHFENLKVSELSPENHLVNLRFDLSQDFINIRKGEYSVEKMIVEQGTNVADLYVARQLNNIRVNDDGRLDILFKNSTRPQRVQRKTLTAIHLKDHAEAEERVDGVPLSTWSEVQHITLTENVIRGDVEVSGTLTAGKGVVATKSFQLTDSDLLHVLRTSAPLNAEKLPGQCHLQFENVDVKGNADILGKVNEVKPSDWIINNPSQHVVITATKTFEGGLHLQKDSRTEALFGSADASAENIFSVLPHIMLDNVDQTLAHENLAFTGEFKVDRALCPDAILAGIPFENLLFSKGDQTVYVDTIFRHPLATQGNVEILENLSVDVVNGIKLGDAVEDTLRTGKDFPVQEIPSEYTFSELMTADAEVAGTFGGSDVDSMFGKIVLKNSREVVELEGAHLTFASGVTMGKLEYIGNVNGIHSSDWGRNWLLSLGDQVVTTKVEFAAPITAAAVEAPSVNNLDIAQFSSGILRIDKDERVGGSLSFMSQVTAEGGVDMPNQANVNGVDLRKDILLKSSQHPQIISGEVKFLAGVTINGKLDANEMSNFDLNNFVQLLKPDGSRQQASLVVNGNVELALEPAFATKINDIVWEDLMQELWLRDRNVVLQHPVHFSTLKLAGGGEMGTTATLNGVDVRDLEETYASKTRDQEWTGNVVINLVDSVHRLETKSLLLDDGLLFNGVNIEDFYRSVLRYTGDQTVLGSITADTLTTNRFDTGKDATINSVRVPEELVKIAGPNRILAKKVLDKIAANEVVLSPNTVIDGVNLGEWERNAVKLDGNFEISGPLVFRGLKTEENVVVDGLVDGVEFNERNIVTMDGDQEIFGHVTVKEGTPGVAALTAPGGVFIENTLNGINVKEAISKMVFKDSKDDTPIVIKGEVEFDAPVEFDKVQTDGLFQGQNVSAVMGKMTRAHDHLSESAFNASERYGDLVNVVSKMLKTVERRAIFLDYFVLTQTIQVAATYVKVLRQVGYPAIAIGYKKSALITTENWWSYNAVVDYYQLQIGNRVQVEGTVVDIAEMQKGKDHLFAFAVNTEGNGRPAQAALEVANTVNSFEINKSPEKLSKTFILKSVESGTANARPAISQVIYGHAFKTVLSFPLTRNAEQVSCLAVTLSTKGDATETSAKILCVDNANGEVLNSVQDLHLESPSLTTAVTVTNKTLVGFLTRSELSQPEGLLEIWAQEQRASSSSIQFSKSSCLPVFNAVALDSLSTDDGRTFLVVASGSLKGSGYEGSVFVYEYSVLTQQFRKTQTILVSSPKDVKLQWLKPSSEVIAYVLSETVTNNVQVYKYKGLGGWTLVHQFTSDNGESIQVANFMTDGVYRAQLLVTSATQTAIYGAEFVGLNPVIEETLENIEREDVDEVHAIDVDNL